jgi:predicted phage terminase large subunit-like protein
MDEAQKALLIDKIVEHFGLDDAETILTIYPATGPSGLRRMLGEIDPEYFCKTYMPDQFDRDFGDYALEMMNDIKAIIEAGQATKEARVAPRGHAKSTICTVAMPAWAACYKKRKYILFLSSNEDTSSNFLGKVKNVLESTAIIEDFGPQKGKTWNNYELETVHGITIECSGWTAGIRGKNKKRRPDLVTFDDLEDKKVMESPSLRAKLEKAFTEEMLKLGDYDTIYIYVGTLLAVDSLLAKVIEKPTWKYKLYKKVISFPDDEGEKLWEDWRTIFRDLKNENRMEDAYHFYLEHKDKMVNGVKMLWPGKYPDDKMVYKGAFYNTMLEREESEDSFWQEDQNQPRSSGDMPFKTIRYWQELYEEPPKIEHLKLTIDPAEGKGLDNTAYTLGGSLHGGVFVRDGQLKDHKLNKIMEHTAWFIQTYPEIDEVIFEENTYKEDGTEQLRQYLVSKGLYRKVTGFRSTDNKHNRILQMEPDINNGLVLFNKINTQYNNEVLMYHNKADRDDAADSLHKLWKTLKKPQYYMG